MKHLTVRWTPIRAVPSNSLGYCDENKLCKEAISFVRIWDIKALSLWTIGVPSIEGGTMLWEGKGCLVYKGTGWKWLSCYKSLFSHIALLSVTWEHLYAFHGTSEMSLLSFSHFRWSFRVSQGSTKVGVIYFSKIMNLYSILLSCYLSNEATPSSCGCM